MDTETSKKKAEDTEKLVKTSSPVSTDSTIDDEQTTTHRNCVQITKESSDPESDGSGMPKQDHAPAVQDTVCPEQKVDQESVEEEEVEDEEEVEKEKSEDESDINDEKIEGDYECSKYMDLPVEPDYSNFVKCC